MFPTVMFIINVSSIAALWVGADRIDAGALQVGSLVAYLSYLIQILMAVVMATFMVSMIPRAAVAAERINAVLDTAPSVQAGREPVTEVSEHATLEFRGVGFHYPGAQRAVLRDISVWVVAGRRLAVIGSTGAGKSTLVNLVPRLFDATQGTVVVNGVDVAELDPDLLWSTVGYVPQRPYLFSARSHPTCGTEGPTQPKPRCGRRWRSPKRRTSCGPWRRGSTAPSPRAAPTCRAGNANAWPLPER